MELHDALTQITEIRAQMARTQVFRGYRAGPVAGSAFLAFLAGAIQAAWITDPHRQIGVYVALWSGAAVLSAVLAGLGMAARRRKMLSSAWSREITWLAIEQFTPCLMVGAVLTAALVISVPEGLPLLPGLWQLLFGLGIYSSCRLLPRPTVFVATFYLISGFVTLVLAHGDSAFSPWAMALPFGIGQLFAAGVLYWTLERTMARPAKETDVERQPVSLEEHTSTGRFSYDGLERAIHEKARLGIMTSLVAHPKGLLFADLKELCALTDGNLSRHLQVLHDEGLVEVWKGFHKKRPQTLCRLTEEGRRRFLEYINELENVIADALAAAKVAHVSAPPSALAEGWTPA